MDVEAVARFAYEAGQLKRLRRAGWQYAGITAPESVAEHSFRVGVLAYAIAVLEGANPDRAAALGLFHDFPESRIGDVPKVGKVYVRTPPAQDVIAEQTSGLPPALAARIRALIDEHESANGDDSTLEARCSRDADKLEALLQAREYQAAGNQLLQPWVDDMTHAITTATGKQLAAAARKLSPDDWWLTLADRFDGSADSHPKDPER